MHNHLKTGRLGPHCFLKGRGCKFFHEGGGKLKRTPRDVTTENHFLLRSLSTLRLSWTNFKPSLPSRRNPRNRSVPVNRLNWKADTSSPSSTSLSQTTRAQNCRNFFTHSKHRSHHPLSSYLTLYLDTRMVTLPLASSFSTR